MEEINLELVNRLLHVDGKNVRAIDVVDLVSRETLVAAMTWIIAKLSPTGK